VPSLATVALLRHPDTPCPALTGLDVSVAILADGSLSLDYRLSGRLAALSIPPAQAPAATDGLWQHTCCEAFIAHPGSPAYREFNLSPSSQWAAYRFSDYRQREDWALPAGIAPRIDIAEQAGELRLHAVLPAALLPEHQPDALRQPAWPPTWQLALSCVVEAADGSRSYWALTHPPGQPDFHQRSNFTLNLSV
jgi:hypothetical protein